MKYRIISLFVLMMTITLQESCAPVTAATEFEWKSLEPIPDEIGFAGSFAGVSNDHLIVAGGANFPDGGAPWTGSKKVWTSKVFALAAANGRWKEIGALPDSLGYGASVSWKGSMIIIGGSNEHGHNDKVWKLNYKNDSISFDSLPSLPGTIANTTAVVLDNKIYLAGGIANSDSKSCENIFWSMNLDNMEDGWKQLTAFPGKARMLHVMAADAGKIYVLSGTELIDGKRNYLTDAWAYDVSTPGWKQLADLPYSVTAAPSPAVAERGQLFVFGGDNGQDAAAAASLKEKHPGFSSGILAYDVEENKWSVAAQVKTEKKSDAAANPNASIWAPVTTTLVQWNDLIILPGGEVRPATRTPNVLSAKLK